MKNNFSGALELINQVCTNTGGQFTVLYDELPVPSIQMNTVKPLHNGYLGDREKWPLWRGGHYGEVIWLIFFREYKYSRPICNLCVNYQHCSIQNGSKTVVVLIESLVNPTSRLN